MGIRWVLASSARVQRPSVGFTWWHTPNTRRYRGYQNFGRGQAPPSSCCLTPTPS